MILRAPLYLQIVLRFLSETDARATGGKVPNHIRTMRARACY